MLAQHSAIEGLNLASPADTGAENCGPALTNKADAGAVLLASVFSQPHRPTAGL